MYFVFEEAFSVGEVGLHVYLCRIISKSYDIIVDNDVSAIYERVKILSKKHMDKHSLLIFTYLVSVLVSILLGNAIGWLSCNIAVPRPYLLASVCLVVGFLSHK